MPGRIKSQDMHSSFKGELIENELYQSADNVIDCKNNKICQYKIVTMIFFNVQIILREDKPVTCTCNIIAF